MTGATTSPWVEAQYPPHLEANLQMLRDRAAANHAPTVRIMQYARGDEHFALYLAIADMRCREMVGLSIFDLADVDWHGHYSDGNTIRAAVLEAIRDDDTASEIFAELYDREP